MVLRLPIWHRGLDCHRTTIPLPYHSRTASTFSGISYGSATLAAHILPFFNEGHQSHTSREKDNPNRTHPPRIEPACSQSSVRVSGTIGPTERDGTHSPRESDDYSTDTSIRTPKRRSLGRWKELTTLRVDTCWQIAPTAEYFAVPHIAKDADHNTVRSSADGQQDYPHECGS